jgi:hypothetical protein
VPMYRFRVTPDVTEQDVLVKFSDDEEALRLASRILGPLIQKTRAETRGVQQKIEVFREDGSLLLSLPTNGTVGSNPRYPGRPMEHASSD